MPGNETTQVYRTYTAFVRLLSSALLPVGMQRWQLTPGRDQAWDVMRVWATAIGYEAQPKPAGSLYAGQSIDPYSGESGDWNGAAPVSPPYLLNPTAAMFRNTIGRENLIQPFPYVPRNFDPIALSQAARINADDQIILLASEIANGGATVDSTRPGRGILFGVDVIELSKAGAL